MKIKLLLSTQRSGSHFLKSYIENNFSRAVCSGAVLRSPGALADQYPALPGHPEISHFWPWYERAVLARKISLMPDRRMEALHVYLQELLDLVKPKDLIVDVKYNSLRCLSGFENKDDGTHDFVSFIIQHEIPVLHLIRRNVLRMRVSLLLAQHTGVWHRYHQRAADEALPKLHIDPQMLLNNIHTMVKLHRDFRQRFAGFPLYEAVHYEEFIKEPGFPHPGPHHLALSRFMEEVPTQPANLDLPYKKTAPENPGEVVENWDEVVRLIRATEHAWMLPASVIAASTA